MKDAIGRLQRELGRIPGADVAWPRMDGIHLTLKFLGDVLKKDIPTLIEVIQQQVELFHSIQLKTSSPGAFPSLHRPRVLWLGLEADKQLRPLQLAVEQACAELGFSPEEKHFHPHLTVGRVKEIEPGCGLTERFAREQVPPISWQANEVLIMSSDLRPSGAVYNVLGTARLSSTHLNY